MKILIISFYEAFPPASGAATVTYNVAKYLDGEKYLIQLSSDNVIRNLEKDVTLINFKYTSDNHFLKTINLATQLPKILSKINQISPDVIIIEGASWTVYYTFLYHLLKLKKIKAKIIYHAHNVEFLLREKKNNRLVALITKWAEGFLMNRADLSTATSEEDAVHFKSFFRVRPIIFPNGVDVENFDRVSESQVQEIKEKYALEGRLVLFMGLSHFMPNVEALDFLIPKVFPHVVEDYPDIKLAVIGGSINFRRSWLINPGRIPFEEVPAFIKACDVCVSPIFSGSGTRLKILEYMAANKPVVSTTKGAEGITIIDKDNIVIADDPDKFAEGIKYLFENQEIAEKIGKKGKDLVRESYSWQSIVKDFTIHMNGLFQ